jgi:hypothetical protein
MIVSGYIFTNHEPFWMPICWLWFQFQSFGVNCNNFTGRRLIYLFIYPSTIIYLSIIIRKNVYLQPIFLYINIIFPKLCPKPYLLLSNVSCFPFFPYRDSTQNQLRSAVGRDLRHGKNVVEGAVVSLQDHWALATSCAIRNTSDGFI